MIQGRAHLSPYWIDQYFETNGRRWGGLTVRVLVFRLKGPDLRPGWGGSVSCVPGQNTFYLHWSISRYWRFVREASWNAGRWPYGGLVSHPCGGGGGVPYGNWDNLPLNGPLGSSADFTFTLKPMTLQLSNLNCKWYPIGGLWEGWVQPC